MARILVLGYGNTLRGDDALGPMTIERLQAVLKGAELAAVHQLTPELAATVAGYDRVIFVDAAYGGEPGSVTVVEVQRGDGPAANLTHHVTPASMLELADTLYGRAPEAVLVTGAGANFESGEGLSREGEKALEEICRRVVAMLQE